MIFKDDMQLTNCVDTHWYLFHSEYPVQWIKHSLTKECPNHDSVHHVRSTWIKFSLTVIWIAMTRTDGAQVPDHISQTEKNLCQISWTKWEHNIRIYCILNTELNIILLHWNKQHLESGIIKWGCRPLDENFHLVLMFTCFAMQICHRVEHWAIWSTRSTHWH